MNKRGRQQTDKNKRAKRITLQAVFAFLSLALVPIYTLAFGTQESPFIYTLSGIGNAFDYRAGFIIWGIVTGLALVSYTLYLFKKAKFMDKRARIFLFSSHTCLVLTVLTPAIKDMLPFWHFLHVVFSSLFAVLLVATLLLFIQYISKSDHAVSKTAFFWLLSCVGFSLLTLFLTGLNGFVEMLFFIGISVFLFVLNLLLGRIRKQDKNKASRPNRTLPVKGDQKDTGMDA